MIALVGASAIILTALQATINAPTESFRGCLREATAKARSEKVSGDGIDAYLRSACSVEMKTLKSAVVAFRTKNGMGRKAAVDDAEMTVEDYVATPVDNYKFMATMNAPAQAANAQPAPAAAPAQATPTAAAKPPK